MKSLVIVIDYRAPRNKEEQDVFGLTETESGVVARIFINARHGKVHMIDTFFHEVAHAFMHWTGFKKIRAGEKVADLVGRAVDKTFREVLK